MNVWQGSPIETPPAKYFHDGQWEWVPSWTPRWVPQWNPPVVGPCDACRRGGLCGCVRNTPVVTCH